MSGPCVNSLSNLRIRRIPILTFRNLLGFRSVKRCRKIVAYGDDSAGRAVVVDPFAVGNSHADAAVGGRSAEFVVFLSGNVVNACGLSRDAVEEDAGVAESCTILTVCGLDEGMPSVFACGFKGSRWSLGIFFSRGTDKGPVRNDISVSIVRGIYGYLAAGTVHNDLERL